MHVNEAEGRGPGENRDCQRSEKSYRYKRHTHTRACNGNDKITRRPTRSIQFGHESKPFVPV